MPSNGGRDKSADEVWVNYYLLHITYPILGAGKLSFLGILTVAVLGCLLADLLWFEAGRRRGRRVLRMLCALAPDPSQSIRNWKSTFAVRGLPALWIAKFVPGLDAIAPPIAGMAGTSRLSFLLYDAGGSALWSGAYIGGGFLFAKELDKVVRYTSVFADTLPSGSGRATAVLLCVEAGAAAAHDSAARTALHCARTAEAASRSGREDRRHGSAAL